MAYTKTDWVDGTTVVNEANLDKIEQGIFDAHAGLPPTVVGQNGKWLTVTGGAMVWTALPASGIQPPAGVVAGEGVLYDGTNWVRWDPIAGAYSFTVSAANTDIAWPAGYQPLVLAYVGTGGGTLRSLGAPTLGSGTRLTLRNGSASNFTILYTAAGGSGVQFFLRSLANLVLAPNEIIEFVYDGSYWVEVARDVAVAAGVAYIPIELRNPQQVSGGVYPNIVAQTSYERWWLEFANADCKVWGQFAVPPNTTPVLANQQIIFDLVAVLTAGNARFNVKTKQIADGGSTNPTLIAVTSQDIVIPTTAGLKKRVTFAVSGETWAAGDTVIVEVMREGAHANDTLAGVCGIIGAYARLA